MSFAFAVLAFAGFQGLDTNQLPIGPKGTVTAAPGQIVETRTGKVVTVDDVAAACGRQKFLFVGENHATTLHQQMEANLVLALVKAGKTPAVGLEMYQRPKQDVLDKWSDGSLEESAFLEQSDWKGQWGYKFDFYRPLFAAVKTNKLPLVGLNVPRDWVRLVGKGGFDALPLSARFQLPLHMSLDNTQHRMVFDSLMGGHDMGPSMKNIYSAQVLWDEGMADTARKYLTVRPPSAKDIFVVVAGSGHVMYRQGINYRLSKSHTGTGITFVMMQSDKPLDVAKGIGDYVYLTAPEPKK